MGGLGVTIPDLLAAQLARAVQLGYLHPIIAEIVLAAGAPMTLLPGLDLPSTPSRKRRGRAGPATPSGRAKKGSRVEREIVALHTAIGIGAARVPFSGSLARQLGEAFAGDLLRRAP